MKTQLLPGECVEADKGYRGDDTTRTPNDFEGRADWRKMKSLARARHETINGMIKEFKSSEMFTVVTRISIFLSSMLLRLLFRVGIR